MAAPITVAMALGAETAMRHKSIGAWNCLDRIEIWFTLLIVALVAVLSIAFDLPINLPSGERAQFVGIHYLYPLIGVAIWGAVALVGQRQRLAGTFLVALPCYALIMVCHFTLKLWVPHVIPVLWDPVFWRIDQALHPLVAACMALRRAIAPIVPLDSNMYIAAFIMMFYLSFCIHALRSPRQFRTLFLAALFFQGFGAIAYYVMPALGPFVHERGVETLQTNAQLSMLQSYRDNVAGGAAWLAREGGRQITVGLGAMPSLHAGGSFLFLLFAWRYARTLLPIYLPLFAFIVIDAIANRWHYLIDIPAGMLLAIACSWLAHRVIAARDVTETAPDRSSPRPLPA
jgi:hypothetical protein